MGMCFLKGEKKDIEKKSWKFCQIVLSLILLFSCSKANSKCWSGKVSDESLIGLYGMEWKWIQAEWIE